MLHLSPKIRIQEGVGRLLDKYPPRSETLDEILGKIEVIFSEIKGKHEACDADILRAADEKVRLYEGLQVSVLFKKGVTNITKATDKKTGEINYAVAINKYLPQYAQVDALANALKEINSVVSGTCDPELSSARR